MFFCVAGVSGAARHLYETGGSCVRYAGFYKAELPFDGYIDDLGGALPGPVLTSAELCARIGRDIDGVYIPEDNYYQVRIATVNALKAMGIDEIYYAPIHGGGYSAGVPTRLFPREKASFPGKASIKIALNINFPNSNNGIYLKNLFEGFFNNVTIRCFTSWNSLITAGKLVGVDILSYDDVTGLYKKGELDCVLFSQKDRPQSNQIAKQRLRSNGLERVFTVPARVFHTFSLYATDLENIFTPDASLYQVGKLDISTTDYCNLNCQGCEHFCGLRNQKTEHLFTSYDMETFKSDIETAYRLLGEEVCQITFLGGEPLLNPLLGDFIVYLRMLYPYMDINIITNGLLITGLEKNALKTIRDNNVWFKISAYPPTLKIKEEIKRRLNEAGIFHIFSRPVTHFIGSLDLSGGNDPRAAFHACYRKYCYSMRNGRLAHCAYILKTDRFNAYFGRRLSVSDGDLIDLSDPAVGKSEVFRFLREPNSFCRYCDMFSRKQYQWAPGNQPQPINYWLASGDADAPIETT